MAISQAQQTALQQYFDQRNIDAVVELAMTYGNPSMESAVQNLLKKNKWKKSSFYLYIHNIVARLPLRYSCFARSIKKLRNLPPIEFIRYYHLHNKYISAIVILLKSGLNLMNFYFFFSWYSIRYENEGDFYRQHCKQTALEIVEHLGLLKSMGSKLSISLWTRRMVATLY